MYVHVVAGYCCIEIGLRFVVSASRITNVQSCSTYDRLNLFFGRFSETKLVPCICNSYREGYADMIQFL